MWYYIFGKLNLNWELIFLFLANFFFVLILVGFKKQFFSFFFILFSLRFGQISPLAFNNYWRRLQDSAFLSDVVVDHLKKARGEIWPKRSEKTNNQDEDKKSSQEIKQIILKLRSLISKGFQIKTVKS